MGTALTEGNSRRERRLDFRSGGWVLLLAVLAGLGTAAYLALPGLLSEQDDQRLGDGRNPESYGFDLGNLTVPSELLVGSGLSRDGLLALEEPATWPPSRVDAWNEENRGKYLVDEDPVIGVVSGGEARAYPLRVLNWHEIANDTLGGRPIAVTYNPLSASAVVFDRRIAEEVVTFGHSGLLYNSNLVLYDRQPEPQESTLWSQLLAEGIAGPRAGESLQVLPASVCRWGTWLEAYPDTTVLAPEPRWMKKYKRHPYSSYFGSDALRFPAEPLPADDRPLKSRVLALHHGGETRIVELERRAQSGRQTFETTVGGVVVRLGLEYPPATYRIEAPPQQETGVSTFYGFRFAWHAVHGGAAGAEGPIDQTKNSSTNMITQTTSR